MIRSTLLNLLGKKPSNNVVCSECGDSVSDIYNSEEVCNEYGGTGGANAPINAPICDECDHKERVEEGRVCSQCESEDYDEETHLCEDCQVSQ